MFDFSEKTAEVFMPDNSSVEEALARTTHLAVGAHPDDVEIMATGVVAECMQDENSFFSCIIVTDGAGSARSGRFAGYSDEMMRQVRKEEQKKAAVIGEYSAVVFLDHSSDEVKSPGSTSVSLQIAKVIKACQPKIVYTHNPADKHDTHVATMLRTFQAIASMEKDKWPEKLYGCEVWRGLDWLDDKNKHIIECGRNDYIEQALVGVFDSQIGGGKRYDLAASGRRKANATFFASHETDQTEGAIFAMDMSGLMGHDISDIESYVNKAIRDFADDVSDRINRFS